MSKIYYYLLILLFFVPLSLRAQEKQWYFPIQNFENRNQYKTFDQYIDKNFYKGKESLFPTQFTGYHVADDLEINKNEENQNVPVYAISDGKITFIGPVSGYGGLLLLNIANDSHTVLYGHVKLNGALVKTGDTVKAGQILSYLGNGFSNETGGERKHLHFGIYNGKDIYYHGYETSEQIVQSKWVDPAAYLKEKGAININQDSSVASNQSSAISNQKENINQNTAEVTNSNNNQTLGTNIPQNMESALAQNQNKGLFKVITNFFIDIFNWIKKTL